MNVNDLVADRCNDIRRVGSFLEYLQEIERKKEMLDNYMLTLHRYIEDMELNVSNLHYKRAFREDAVRTTDVVCELIADEAIDLAANCRIVREAMEVRKNEML